VSAPVRIEARAWNDPRFRTLARLTGLGDPDFAIIKVARIWSWQTERFGEDRNAYVVDRDTVESILGDNGWDALIRSKLADEVPGGLRMRGTEGQIEWCADLTSKRQHAGRTRAAKARRDDTGRMVGNEDNSQPAHAGCAGPANDPHDQQATSTEPPQSSAPTPSPSPEDLSLARARAIPQPPTPSLDSLWSEFEAERQRVGSVIGVKITPLVGHDPGRHDLALALSQVSSVGDRDRVVVDARKAIAVAGAEVESGKRELKWFTGVIFEGRNWRALCGSSVEEARKQRAPPRGASRDQKPEPNRPPTRIL
jgi:hypothetical protein